MSIKDVTDKIIIQVISQMINTKGFNRWRVADNTGWTVAHEAAKHGILPDDFDQWDIADENGWTVEQEYLANR